MPLSTVNAVRRILDIHQASEGLIRPHFILTGPSGSGKSHTMMTLCDEMGIEMIEVNCAQLTKEGLAGNSLSKALTKLEGTGLKPVVVFMDEFDKLFISGNSNDSHAHESTLGVQNELLKVLESPTTDVLGQYGHYNTVPVDHVLFVFAGAFNGEENIDLDRLRAMGVKTEFLGRVGLTFPMVRPTLDEMLGFLDDSVLLQRYLKLHPNVDAGAAKAEIAEVIKDNYEQNTLGVRMLNTLVHQFFINGTLKKVSKSVTFQRALELPTPLFKE